jgi:4-hydroxybenzoate polyprenyltransferase
MEIVKKRQFHEIILGFFLLSHPVPVLFHIIAVTLFTLLAAWQHPIWNIIILIIAAHAAMQVSIAMLNDYCDRRLDAEGKKNKPIPRGLVTPREALVAGLIMIAVMLALLLLLPPLALFVSLCYLALGQAYNLGLKSTPWSGIVFAFLFWLVPLGFFLGIALNLANSLPDIEKDAAGGAKTLAVFLGVKRSFLVCQLLIVLTAALIGLLTVLRIVPARPWIIVATLILACLSIEARVLFFGPEKPVETRKLYFYVVTLTCIVLAGGWLLGVLL